MRLIHKGSLVGGLLSLLRGVTRLAEIPRASSRPSFSHSWATVDAGCSRHSVWRACGTRSLSWVAGAK